MSKASNLSLPHELGIKIKRANEGISAAERASQASSAEQVNEGAVRANERTYERVAQYLRPDISLSWPDLRPSSLVGNPFYLTKTRLQACAASAVAVGFQYKQATFAATLKDVYGKRGFWAGVNTGEKLKKHKSFISGLVSLLRL